MTVENTIELSFLLFFFLIHHPHPISVKSIIISQLRLHMSTTKLELLYKHWSYRARQLARSYRLCSLHLLFIAKQSIPGDHIIKWIIEKQITFSHRNNVIIRGGVPDKELGFM